MSDLPEDLDGRFGAGLLQLFYCVEPPTREESLSAWEAFARPTVTRIVQATGRGQTKVSAPPNYYPARTIIRWDIGADYPSQQEHRELGLVYDYNFEAKQVTIRWPETGLELNDLDFETAASIAGPQGGDKLSGWPYWVQSAEYPSCPQCGQRMDFVFQIDSENNLPYMFGDVGCGHVTQCPTHKDVVAFGWACC